MLATLNDHLIESLNPFSILDYIKSGPELIETEDDNRFMIKWNGLLVCLWYKNDCIFFDFDLLCKALKKRKIKTWNSSTTVKSAFETHFSGLKERHPERFFEGSNGHHFIHVMYMEIAAKGLLMNAYGVDWFYGDKNWDESCGKGWIYLIYIKEKRVFKYGKAELNRFENRLTTYLNKYKKGVMILGKIMVSNMSLGEDIVGFRWEKQGFINVDEGNEYYSVPKLKGETDRDRALRVLDSVFDALESVEPTKELECYDGWDWDENVRFPVK